MKSSLIETLIEKYDRPVPRYTSYPTAVQFTQIPEWHEHKNLLHSLNCEEPISVYIHIPFCHSLCLYCGCHTKIVNRHAPIQHYVNMLLEEIKLFKDNAAGKIRLGRLHFGGGSPNYAGSQNLQQIYSALSNTFTFGKNLQVDMECDPRLLTEENIKAFADIGVTRVSLGIQDFNAKVQSAINRVQPYEMIESCIKALRKNGIGKINFDLMTGLPFQTSETVLDTVDKTLSLAPERIALFAYAHVPWMKKHQALLEKYPMPNTLERFKMAHAAGQILRKNGYTAIGFDHFALQRDSLSIAQKKGTLRRNFQGYTDDPAKTVIGFGLSAISQFEDAYIQNSTDASAYRNALKQGRIPSVRACYLTGEDRIRRTLIEHLMCNFEASLGDFPDVPVPYESLAPLLQDGLATLSMPERILRITKPGRPFVRLAAACFDTYLNPTGGRHARAI